MARTIWSQGDWFPGTKSVERPRTTYFSNVEPSEIFLEDVSFYQQVEEVAAAHVFQNLIERGIGEIDRLSP